MNFNYFNELSPYFPGRLVIYLSPYNCCSYIRLLFLWKTYLVYNESCSLVEINDWIQVSVCLNCLTGLIWSTGFEATKRESSADSPGDLVRSQILFLYFILFFQPTMSWFLVNSFCKCRPTKTMCSTRQVFEFLKKYISFCPYYTI